MSNAVEYSEGTSPLHRANPVSKVFLAICICVSTFLAQGYPMLLGLLAFTVGMSFLGGVGRRTLKLLAGLLAVSAVMFLIQTAISRQGQIVFLWVTDHGASVAAHAGIRLLTFALPLMVMLWVTRPTDLANAFVEVLHVPYKYAFTITTALRFVPIFSEEMDQIVEAQTARGVEYDSGNIFHRFRLMMPLMVPLLISSVSKADDTALAAEERGFYLRTRESSYKRYPMRALDLAIMGVGVALVVLGVLF